MVTTSAPVCAHNAITFLTACLLVVSSGVKIILWLSNSLALRASIPDFSAPAIGWAGTKPLGISSPNTALASAMILPLVLPTSMIMVLSVIKGLICSKIFLTACTGVAITTKSDPCTARAASSNPASSSPYLIPLSMVDCERLTATIDLANFLSRMACAKLAPMSPSPIKHTFSNI